MFWVSPMLIFFKLPTSSHMNIFISKFIKQASPILAEPLVALLLECIMDLYEEVVEETRNKIRGLNLGRVGCV